MSPLLPKHLDESVVDSDHWQRNGLNSSSSGRSLEYLSTPYSLLERHNFLRNILTDASTSLDTRVDGIPERDQFASHEAWLTALLTTSLDQSEETCALFRDSPATDEQQDASERSKNASP